VPPIRAYFEKLIDALEHDENADLKAIIKRDEDYAFLMAPRPKALRSQSSGGKGFSKNSKSAAAISSLLESAPTCRICGARVHMKSMQIDHNRRRREGGTNEVQNAQLAHPICNSHKG
jgi:5-methylcytosine-specific restriction endonuclease McrA